MVTTKQLSFFNNIPAYIPLEIDLTITLSY